MLIAAAISNVAVDFGYGLAAGSQGPNHESNSLKYSAISQAIVVLAATAGRIGFILYLIELLAARTLHRMVLWLLIPFQILVNVFSVFLLFFQCSVHVGELFHPGQQSHCESLDIQIKYGYFQGGMHPPQAMLLSDLTNSKRSIPPAISSSPSSPFTCSGASTGPSG